MMTNKNYFLKNERGFVLIEFIIALPLLILLICALGTLSVRTLQPVRERAADYVLETEAQYVLERIVQSARSAVYVEIWQTASMDKREEIFFISHSIGNEVDKKKEYFHSTSIISPSGYPDVINLLDTRFYTVYKPTDQDYRIYAKRKEDNTRTNPITGNSFLGDTTVNELSFDVQIPKVLHVTLELESKETHKILRVSTAVYMPACNTVIDSR